MNTPFSRTVQSTVSGLTYNTNNDILTLTQSGGGDKAVTLPSGSIVSDLTFDANTDKLTLTQSGGGDKEVTLPSGGAAPIGFNVYPETYVIPVSSNTAPILEPWILPGVLMNTGLFDTSTGLWTIPVGGAGMYLTTVYINLYVPSSAGTGYVGIAVYKNRNFAGANGISSSGGDVILENNFGFGPANTHNTYGGRCMSFIHECAEGDIFNLRWNGWEAHKCQFRGAGSSSVKATETHVSSIKIA